MKSIASENIENLKIPSLELLLQFAGELSDAARSVVGGFSPIVGQYVVPAGVMDIQWFEYLRAVCDKYDAAIVSRALNDKKHDR